jgi:hypothetical protein
VTGARSYRGVPGPGAAVSGTLDADRMRHGPCAANRATIAEGTSQLRRSHGSFPISGTVALRPLALLCALLATGCARSPPSRLRTRGSDASEATPCCGSTVAPCSAVRGDPGCGLAPVLPADQRAAAELGARPVAATRPLHPCRGERERQGVVLRLAAHATTSSAGSQDCRSPRYVPASRCCRVASRTWATRSSTWSCASAEKGMLARLDGVCVRSRWQPEAARDALGVQYPEAARAMLDADGGITAPERERQAAIARSPPRGSIGPWATASGRRRAGALSAAPESEQ